VPNRGGDDYDPNGQDGNTNDSNRDALRQYAGIFKKGHRLIAIVADMRNKLNSKPRVLAFG